MEVGILGVEHYGRPKRRIAPFWTVRFFSGPQTGVVFLPDFELLGARNCCDEKIFPLTTRRLGVWCPHDDRLTFLLLGLYSFFQVLEPLLSLLWCSTGR